MKPSLFDCVIFCGLVVVFVCAGWVITSAIFEHVQAGLWPILGSVVDRNLVL